MNTSVFWEWVNERHATYIRKWIREGGFEAADDAWPFAPEGADLEECDPDHLVLNPEGPLTHDPVLQQYRFCNVFRELDRVTVWVEENIRRPYADHPDLWIMLAVARYVNWPDTLACLISDNPDDWWLPTVLTEGLGRRAALGHKVYTGAYMIRAPNHPDQFYFNWSKHRYIAELVIGRLWDDRDVLRRAFELERQTLQNAWGFLSGTKRYIGWGPFMSYQAVVDMRHTRLLRDAPDINTWSALGPGSRRGLNRLAGRPLNYNLRQEEGLAEMRSIWEEQDAHRAPWVPPIELSDIQNCLCEVDKLLRVRNGEGRPRAQYVSGRGY